MHNPSWWFDELKHAGEEHIDAERVAGYDVKSGFDPFPELKQLEALGLGSAHTFIDLGAGTGVLALEVARRCRRVVAVDVSRNMLNVLQHKAEQMGVRNVEAVRAGFLTYEHQGDKADFVYTRNALHHLPDFWKVQALVRIAGMLKPGGIFRLHDLVYSFDPQDVEPSIEAWLGGASDQPGKGFPKHELLAHVQEEYSTYTWLLVVMLERAGF
jgi:ubiquinone/menaquinone biosynthesis C-methylase UbiE